ncbi:hypothetical protein, partial [Bacillus wiedmannii]|uniref:hypothetical protein n=1 Tax=Bacillus wiedmannii TaxID=1890302 RepID=UPI0034D5F641
MRKKTRPNLILLKKRPIHRNRKLRLVHSPKNEYRQTNTGTRLIYKIINFLGFVSVIVGIIYYTTNDDFLWINIGVTEEEALTITHDVVKTQTQLILEDLGVGDDGISSKIIIHNTYPDDGFAGLFNGHYVIANGVKSYVQKSGVIDIYPMVYFMRRDKDGNLVSIPSTQRPNKDGFREAMNQVLAHELR